MRLLIVEDESRLAASLKKGLELERYTVDLAADGIAGFDLAVDGDYDLIILDLMLPGLDGLEICRRLRRQQISTPILILTARGDIRDRITGLDSGADDYLPKPFSFEELLARIRALARRPRRLNTEILSFGDLKFNLQTYEVSRAGHSLTLSRREFSLLEYFLRHPRQILTKDQIIAHVWNYDSDILPNTVEVFIKKLRAKINFPKLPLLIQTVRGFGYRLDSHV